jgi:hypothetical protein
MRKETIVKAYKDMVSIYNGKVIGEHVFRKYSKISSGYWQGRYWRSWSEFQAELGFKPNVPNTRIPNEVLLRRYAELALELKKIPTHIDLILRRKADRTFPDSSTFWHLGTKEKRLASLAAFCEGKPEFAFVLELIRRYREKKERARERRPSRNVQGIVYLARQGSGYKLGRIHASGGQHSLESYTLANRADTVHAIDTDDPAGIEFYWRRRFRLRRQGRDSFRLTDQDLNAFRYRRFQ